MTLPAPPPRIRQLAPGTRARRLLLGIGAAVAFVGAGAYLAAMAAVEAAPSGMMRALVNGALAGGAAALYLLVAEAFQARQHNPIRALWAPVLVGASALGTALVLVALIGGAPSVEIGTGVAGSVGGALASAAVAGLETAFALVLLLFLRQLVLFKRTRAAVRNWALMLTAMGLTALLVAPFGPLHEPDGVFGTVEIGTVVVAVVLMVMNAFRLSWVVYLSTRQKWITIGLAVGLITLLGAAVGLSSDGLLTADRVKDAARIGDDGPSTTSVFSLTLATFTSLAYAFGILYASTAVLSLLFHLPTTVDFEQKAGEVQALGALAALSDQVLDREKLLGTIARAPVETGAAQAAWLALVEPESGSLQPRVVASAGVEPGRAGALCDVAALAQAALDRGRPLVLDRAATDHRVFAKPGDGVGSIAVLPLVAQGRERGALFAARAVADAFEADDVAGLATFAAQAALALESADLVADRLERERLQQQLSIAREVQRRLLPTRMPDVPGADLAAVGLSALEVCGDYYDAVDLGGGCTGLLVADVSGKGAAAAFYMAELKGIVQAAAPLTRSPAEFLTRANEALRPSLGGKTFITALYAILDPHADGGPTLTVARAGHCPAALVRAGGDGLHVRPDGLGLGLAPTPVFQKTIREETIRLRPGDAVALYTDGLSESRDARREEFGYDRVLHSLRADADADAWALLDRLLDDRHAFTDGEDLDDDLTLVVLRWTGAEARAASADGAQQPHPLPVAQALPPTPAPAPAPPDPSPVALPAPS